MTYRCVRGVVWVNCRACASTAFGETGLYENHDEEEHGSRGFVAWTDMGSDT